MSIEVRDVTEVPSMSSTNPTRPFIVIVGQTPPPWHGQAVATQLLFDYDWPGFEVHRVRMAFSSEMEEIGRVQFSKLLHLMNLWRDIREARRGRSGGILIYPPASPNWVPLLRDLILLPRIRRQFDSVVYIYHAGGVGEWCSKTRIRRWIARKAYGQSDLALEVARERISPHEVFQARSWAWTPYGVAIPDLPTRTSKPPGPTVVVFVGSLQEGKGVIEILRTASLLKKLGKENDFRFRIVGRWFSKEFENHSLHLRSELKLNEMVEFPGQLTGQEKWQAYTGADVFFFPTHYESEAFPLVLIEALACGLPVVTTRWRGIPDLVGDSGVASLCDIRSPDQYANALVHWRSQSDRATENASIARKFYEERYLPEQFLSQIRELVSGLPSTSGRAEMDPRSLLPKQTFRTYHAKTPLPSVCIYLADQNPGYDRSFGISRMSQVIIEALLAGNLLNLSTIASKTSQQAPSELGTRNARLLPWGTRRKWIRLLTDHLHPLFTRSTSTPDLHYFPKGYLPLLNSFCRPAVVTIHDTIIQYDEDHYPKWRSRWEYGYWAKMLKHTLSQADRILTVSESSKRQIHHFMKRHRIPAKEITVTYEPCAYERLPQPAHHLKKNYVIHLASVEPHKRTAHLIRWWHEAELQGRSLPMLHLIGSVPPEASSLLASSHRIVKLPFLEDSALQAAYQESIALILPSEVEGFGLPALEAYYLGTPVCFVTGTSVEEILGVATHKGGFSLANAESLFSALDEVMAMDPDEIRECGLKLRETYAAEKVAQRMVEAFRGVAAR